MIEKAKAVLELSRPFTLLAPLVGGLAFSYLGYALAGGDPWKIPAAAFALVLANYTSNVINQIYDRDIDAVNKPNRPIPSGRISVDEASSLAIALTIAVMSISYAAVGTAFGALVSVIMLFAWLYSSPPLRLRARLLWSNLAIATPRGALGILAAYSSYANPLGDAKLLLFALGMAVYVFGGNTFKDFPDEAGDRMHGVRNFVTVYGREKAAKIASALSAASIAPIALSLERAALALPFAALVCAQAVAALKMPRARAGTENTAAWTLFYLGMAAAFASYLIDRLAVLKP